MFSWVRFYRELMTDAKERAEQATDLSVRTTYRAMADGWAARLKDAQQKEDRKKIPGTHLATRPGTRYGRIRERQNPPRAVEEPDRCKRRCH